MPINNPYYYHPQPAVMLAADDVFSQIASHSDWQPLFEQGKMLGVLIVDTSISPTSCVHKINNVSYLAAYSGVINGLNDHRRYFVPPIYDLQKPDDFYLLKDAEISSINKQIKDLEVSQEITKLINNKIASLKAARHQLSISLQKEIFSHFNICNYKNEYRNIIDVFADSKRGLPPGGSGECAAPRLLQYAFEHHLTPLALAEFWYGQSPKQQLRIHGRFYPSCIEKCSPLLKYMIPSSVPPAPESKDELVPTIVYEDDYIIAVNKPSGLLSVPSKDFDPNLEQWLHAHYPDVKGPMLVHRLDQSTSGIMLATKDAITHKALQQQFENKQIRKMYIALLKGRLRSHCGILHLPLSVNPDDRPRQIISHQFGKTATTYYQVVDSDNYYQLFPNESDCSLLELFPLTGRTHQLRVHCASPYGLDIPIKGDSLYDIMDDCIDERNSAEITIATRLYLHAEKITFVHPITKQLLNLYSTLVN